MDTKCTCNTNNVATGANGQQVTKAYWLMKSRDSICAEEYKTGPLSSVPVNFAFMSLQIHSGRQLHCSEIAESFT
jgi:hypothetical protein